MTLSERVEQAWRDGAAIELLAGDDIDHDVETAEPPVAAAVLVAFVERDAPTIILTRRTEQLRAHGGQVAFPGGRLEPGEDAVAAALREAQEEVALSPKDARVIASATPYRTGTNFTVTPVIAVVPPDLALRACPGEVASVFEARVDRVFDPDNHVAREGMWRGAMRRYWEIMGHDEEMIWGATAGIVVNLGRRLGLDRDPRRFNRDARR